MPNASFFNAGLVGMRFKNSLPADLGQAVGLVELRGQGYAVQSGARRPILHHCAGFKNPPSCGNFNRVLGSGVLLRPVSAGVARGASRARCLEIQDEE